LAYSIHIERRDATGVCEPITKSEWLAAVGANRSLRIRTEDFVARNPQTGEPISIKTTGLDAEFFREKDEDWIPAFFWSSAGTISFDATDDFDDPDAPLRSVAGALARSLNASLIGDEGEIYA
jgi:hypothetical protein